jgi:anionic cell wall polymer biosynthesis LytR-Cps2A-Psr (LCP) family protein
LGVNVVVAEITTNGGHTFTAGPNHLDGEQVRWYLAQRKNLPGGDFDRVNRQQQYLRAMFSKLFSSDTFTDPARLDSAMVAVTSAVSIDDTLDNGDLLTLAYSLRDVTPDSIEFFTSPELGTGMEGPSSGERRLPRLGRLRADVDLPAQRLACRQWWRVR